MLPSRVTVSKSVDINAPSERVMSQIENFENWGNWYPAFKDENISVTKDSSKLQSVILKDKKGKMIHLSITELHQNTINIQVESSSATAVFYQFILTPKMNNQTQLTWNVNIDLGWLPWKKVEGIFMDKFSGPQYEMALKDLSNAAEN